MILNYRRVHFIGIGGIGMSALARLFKSRGYKISGSDLSKSEITDNLEKEGIEIFLEQKAENISSDIDCIVYTIAVKNDNPEFIESQKRNLPIFTYAQMLGKISENYFTIAVSGTHGKTTTTAMLIKTFEKLNLKPNAIVGSLLSESKTNFVSGLSNYFIVEACEYGRSFHNLLPKILIITNVEEDHLDYYSDLKEIQGAFVEMILKVPSDGYIVCNLNDKNVKEILEELILKSHKLPEIIDYSIFLEKVPQLSVPGKHNKMNAGAVMAVMEIIEKLEKNDFAILESFESEVQKALIDFKGTWRRLELKGQTINGALVYDDYAHHPSEIESSLLALKDKYPDKKIMVIFQPHLFSRTKNFLEKFAEVLKQNADRILILPIYAAREKFDETIDSIMIIESIDDDKSEHVANFFEATRLALDKNIDGDWIIITMGAGDINRIANMLSLNLDR
jgi:UDP-N-acetylmuramate--alanine ligase